MGRFPKGSFYPRDKDMLKIKHRNADSKYRSKVQFLYSKLKTMVKTRISKDGLMEQTLSYIKNLEAKIYNEIGDIGMKNLKDEFLEFLLREDLLWKREKDLDRWWLKVETCLDDDLIHSDSDFESKLHNNSSSIHNKKPKQGPVKKLVYVMKVPGNVSEPYHIYKNCDDTNQHELKLPSFSKVNYQIHPASIESTMNECEVWNPPNTQNLQSSDIQYNKDNGNFIDETTMSDSIFEDSDIILTSSQENVAPPFITEFAECDIAPFAESSIRHL